MKPSFHTPNPYRRAIAQSIELERTHDALCRIVGHAVPLPDRIVPSGQRKGEGRMKMNLGRPLTLEAMNDVADARLGALQDLATRIGPLTRGFETLDDALHMDGLGRLAGDDSLHDDAETVTDLIERAGTTTTAEQNMRPPFRRGPSRNVAAEDRMSSLELEARDVARAADAPPPPREEPRREEPKAEQRSVAVDLIVEGLLDFHRIDRDALLAELLAFRDKADARRKNATAVALASPAERSNTAATIRTLGRDFPPAVFELRGLALDTKRLLLRGTRDEAAIWSYSGGSSGSDRDQGMPTLTRGDGMEGYDVFDFPNRALRDLTGDRRFHDALVVHMVDRYGAGTADPRTVIRLRRGYAHLDPPTPAGPTRFVVRRASDVRAPTQARAHEHRDLQHAAMIVSTIARLGHRQRCEVRLDEGRGLRLLVANPGSDRLAHTFPIDRDTIDDGPDAIVARLEIVSKHLRDWECGVGAHYAAARTRMGGVEPDRGSAAPAKAVRTPAAAVADAPVRAPMAPVAEPTIEEATAAMAAVPPVGNDIAAEDMVRDEAEDATGTDGETDAAATARDAIAPFGDDALSEWDASERVDALMLDLLDAGLDPDAVHLHHQERMTLVRETPLGVDVRYRLERYDRTMGRVSHAIGVVTVDKVLPASVVEALRDGTVARLVPYHKRFGRSQVRKVSLCEGATLVTVRVQLEERPE